MASQTLLQLFPIIFSTLILLHPRNTTADFSLLDDSGGGVGTPLPPPLVFADQRLKVVYPIIQNFKAVITSDPLNITGTWVGPDICTYKGFYCDHPPSNASATALASIDFNGFQLAAPSLDGFIDQLPDLALFHANSNFFSGPISENIANLPYLYEFDVSNNNFSGPFPNAILAMSGLSFLDIRFNSFSGSVPAQLFTKDLDALFINNNNFMQMQADTLGNSHIYYLTFANNKFIGPIPRGIFKSSALLTEVLFLNNMFSGCIPYEIRYLKEAVVFDAGNNRLTGPIPLSLGCLSKVEIVNFAGNLLYGMVPEVVCLLENLANLSLSGNYFTSVGPICRSLIRKGVLDDVTLADPQIMTRWSWKENSVIEGREAANLELEECKGSRDLKHNAGAGVAAYEYSVVYEGFV